MIISDKNEGAILSFFGQLDELAKGGQLLRASLPDPPGEGLDEEGGGLGGLFGDLGGLSIAYKAWKLSLKGKPSPVIDGFTGDQRVFMGWAQAWRTKAREQYLRQQVMADPHAPAEFRANVPLANIQGFYDAFGVKAGDKMYLDPAKRVKIW